jgi:striatin 1/3/4
MRFLQTEWHRHERDRNAWEIERAEMKAKIAKLEGSSRSSKRQEEMLSKHVKMLEKALKLEREKVKAAKTDDKATGNASEVAENHASKDKAKDGFGNLKRELPKQERRR